MMTHRCDTCRFACRQNGEPLGSDTEERYCDHGINHTASAMMSLLRNLSGAPALPSTVEIFSISRSKAETCKAHAPPLTDAQLDRLIEEAAA